MPEPVFLLILMAVTGLGVWTFLNQLNTGRLALPKVGMPRLAFPRLPVRGRRKRGRGRRRRADDRFELEAEDAGVFVPALATFGPGTGYVVPSAVPYEVASPEQDEFEDDEYDLLPSQVDFFAPDDGAASHRRPSPSPGNVVTAVYAGGPEASATESPAVDLAQSEAAVPFQVAAEPDPDDIMSFFDKPSAATQLPETLRESLETVSAAELLAEARQLHALIQARRDVG